MFFPGVYGLIRNLQGEEKVAMARDSTGVTQRRQEGGGVGARGILASPFIECPFATTGRLAATGTVPDSTSHGLSGTAVRFFRTHVGEECS